MIKIKTSLLFLFLYSLLYCDTPRKTGWRISVYETLKISFDNSIPNQLYKISDKYDYDRKRWSIPGLSLYLKLKYFDLGIGGQYFFGKIYSIYHRLYQNSDYLKTQYVESQEVEFYLIMQKLFLKKHFKFGIFSEFGLNLVFIYQYNFVTTIQKTYKPQPWPTSLIGITSEFGSYFYIKIIIGYDIFLNELKFKAGWMIGSPDRIKRSDKNEK
ncbi:MAG: hypothetical protein A2096_13620 [Spirochaetes bacterium GWF1_41_5]|nr:MAG: hypothetical protein A2096_13620 [Spirochaetes bacterium GWF1_41_5]HBE02938.1 hypothetical protein [Spirochaetia bacterium]